MSADPAESSPASYAAGDDDRFGIVGTTQAGAFAVEAMVAEGGFAVIYRAQHIGFQAPVALKCLKIPEGLSPGDQAELLETFRREAEVTFKLSSVAPAVVRPLHVGALATTKGAFVPFMALEWLEGETLEEMIARRQTDGLPPTPIDEVVRLLTPVARALERAHTFEGSETAHCDIKPENIFLAWSPVPTAKILDFGIAHVRSAASELVGRRSQVQRAGAASGFSPAYAAPEQWMPRKYGGTGPWTDVYGMALTLVETSLGRPIVTGDMGAMMETTCDTSRRPTPRALGVQVTDEVEAAFGRALAVDPRLRPGHLGLFWDELEAALAAAPRTASGIRAKGRGAESTGILRSPGSSSSLPAAPVSVPAIPPAPALPAVPPTASEPPGVLSALEPMRELIVDADDWNDAPIEIDWERVARTAPPPKVASAPPSPLRTTPPRIATPPPGALRTPLPAAPPPTSVRPPAASTPSVRIPAPPPPPSSLSGGYVSQLAPALRPSPAEAQFFKRRFGVALLVAILGILLTAGDLAWTATGHAPLTVLDLPLAWLARPLAVVGPLLVLWRLLGPVDDTQE